MTVALYQYMLCRIPVPWLARGHSVDYARLSKACRLPQSAGSERAISNVTFCTSRYARFTFCLILVFKLVIRKDFSSQDCSYMSFPDTICGAEAGQEAELGGEAMRTGADWKMSERASFLDLDRNWQEL